MTTGVHLNRVLGSQELRLHGIVCSFSVLSHFWQYLSASIRLCLETSSSLLFAIRSGELGIIIRLHFVFFAMKSASSLRSNPSLSVNGCKLGISSESLVLLGKHEFSVPLESDCDNEFESSCIS